MAGIIVLSVMQSTMNELGLPEGEESAHIVICLKMTVKCYHWWLLSPASSYLLAPFLRVWYLWCYDTRDVDTHDAVIFCNHFPMSPRTLEILG